MDFKHMGEKIESLKQRLDKLIELHGLQSKEVLKCSQELDVLICSSYNKDLFKKTFLKKSS